MTETNPSRRLVVASVNQDAGIGPERAKGAAVHLQAMRKAFEAMNVECIALDEPDDRKLRDALASHLAAGKLDLIYERYALGKSTAARFSASTGVPLVLEVNAPLAEEQQRWRQPTDPVVEAREDAITMGQACGVVAVSSAVGEYALGRGASPDRVTVLPNAVDRDYFNPMARQASKKSQLVPPGRFVLGFHGRLRPWHGFEMMVDLAHALLDRGHDIHLLIVGQGEFKALGKLPDDRFTRVEWQPHALIPRYIGAFDVMPLTYQPDMPCYFSPLKLREAMACGVVPVVPELGDLPSVVQHGKNGLLYRPGSLAELARQVESLIQTPALLRNLGLEAAESAMSYTWMDIAERVLQMPKQHMENSGVQSATG